MKNFQSRLIGITGGIATGKSTVSETLKDLGYVVICADEIVHEFYDTHHPLFPKLFKLFGKKFLKPDQGTVEEKTPDRSRTTAGDIFQQSHQILDRQKIAKAVFEDQNLKKKLEDLLHPEVRRQMEERTGLLSKQGHKIIFWDVPLLFESKMEALFEKILCVASSQENQIERLKKRGVPLKEALRRVASQMSLREKIKKSHYILHNNRSKSELKKKIKIVLKKIVIQ